MSARSKNRMPSVTLEMLPRREQKSGRRKQRMLQEIRSRPLPMVFPRFPQTMLRLIKLPSRKQMRRIQQMLPNGTMGPITISCGRQLTLSAARRARRAPPPWSSPIPTICCSRTPMCSTPIRPRSNARSWSGPIAMCALAATMNRCARMRSFVRRLRVSEW